MGNVRYVPDPTFEAELLASPEMRTFMASLTDDVADEAERLAPRRLGHLAAGVEGDVELVAGVWVGRVWDDDFKAAWHEFGTRKMHAHPYLRPALYRILPGATITGGERAVR